MREVRLEPGWLERQMDDVQALERAARKVAARVNAVRKNGITQPVTVEFTVYELRQLSAFLQILPR